MVGCGCVCIFSACSNLMSQDIVVLRFSCMDEEMDSYVSMLTYLVKKHRCGVINCCFPGMKDMYLVPLQASAPVASQLLPFKGPGECMCLLLLSSFSLPPLPPLSTLFLPVPSFVSSSPLSPPSPPFLPLFSLPFPPSSPPFPLPSLNSLHPPPPRPS